MSEQATWKALRPKIIEQDPYRIESMVGMGVPDVWCKDCAIELKCLPAWPKRPATPVSLNHPLTKEQYLWLNRRWRAGGRAFVIVQVARKDWYLFCAPDAGILLKDNAVPRARWIDHAVAWSDNGWNVENNKFFDMPMIALESYRLDR